MEIMENLLVVEMCAVCLLKITVSLLSVDLFTGMHHELIKLLISAQFHLIHHSQGRVKFSLYVPQTHMRNVRYCSSHL